MGATTSTSDKEWINIIRSLLMDRAYPQAQGVVNEYFEGFVSILTDLRAAGYDTRKLEDIFIKALRDEKNGGYINHTCELAAAGYFMKNFPEKFRCQVEGVLPSGIGPAKSFDFSFAADGHVFNVGVKTFSPKPIDNDAPSIKIFLPQSETGDLYGQGMRFSSNCATNIGRFLKDANAQLVRPKGGLSVVLLCCNDLDEYVDALTSFVSPHGICNKLAKEGLVPSTADLPNIDAVVICNLSFNHCFVVDFNGASRFYSDENISIADGGAPWNYATAFSVGFFLRQESRPESLVRAFMTTFHSNHLNISNRMEQEGGDVQQAVFDLYNAVNNRVNDFGE
ncbi:MAG: hypothetical protein M0003_03470 [Acidithiobacillus sp.]|nr:hypothetical protein [Acidithiobacillus sp.]